MQAISSDLSELTDFDSLLFCARQLAAYLEHPEPLQIPAFETKALIVFAERLGLSVFERNCVLLLAGLNISSELADVVGRAEINGQPSFGYFLSVLSALPSEDQLSIAPNGSLRCFQLVHFADGSAVQAVNLRPLVLDEWVFLWLLEHQQPDAVLMRFVKPLNDSSLVFTSQQQHLIQTMCEVMSERGCVQLLGSESELRLHLGLGVANKLGLKVFQMSFEQLEPVALDDLAVRWNRFARVTQAILFIDLGLNSTADSTLENSKVRLAESLCQRVQSKLIISARFASAAKPEAVRFEIERPSGLEQRSYWQQRLEASGVQIDAVLQNQITALSYQFDFPVAFIEKSIQQSLGLVANQDLPKRLWSQSLNLVRPKLEGLTERMIPAERAEWSKLVLPDHDLATLQRLVSHVRERQRIYEEWGWRREGTRGFGISALFGGSSGTGKTFSAEIIAKELNMDLQRIDLPSIVSKYIGESEKLLSKLFDAAEYGGCILLFDEADAVFGKRSEVKDSNDRYANLEVSYLLQRMESFRGLVILTTNQESNMDSAFLRRIRFVVHYPTPDNQARLKLWQGIFPPETPIRNLEFARLAQLEVAGGNIRNIALNAAFHASGDNQEVQMKHIRQAALEEIRKIKRLPRVGEFDNWE